MTSYKKLGFTLLEMLVTIAIIAIMTTLFLVNYKVSNDSYIDKKAISDFIATGETAVYKVLGYNDTEGMENMFEVSGWAVSVENEKKYILFPAVGNSLSYNKKPELEPYFIEKSLPEDMIFTKVNGCNISFSTGEVSETSEDLWLFDTAENSGRVYYAYSYDASDSQTFNYASNSHFPLLTGMYQLPGQYATWDCANFYFKNTKTQAEHLVRMYSGGLIEQIY